MRSISLVLCFLATVGVGASAAAQAPVVDGRDEYFPGSELEEYLRTLETLGLTAVYPWSLRKFSPREIDHLMPADTARHPWQGRYDFSRRPRPRAYVRLIRPVVGARYNSGYPWGLNDGAVWAGRGSTAWASGGFAARWGPVSMVVNPIGFAAQNGDFPILSNGRPGRLQFGDGRFSNEVDYPQRFGDGAYARLDLGESTLRVDYAGVSVGASNAHEWWGPAQRYPHLLGTNAAGFPHVFVGTTRPANAWLLKLHGRVLWGRLDESEYFEATGMNSFLVRPRRFATGVTLVAQPRGLEQLELGVSRFVHAPWPDSGLPGRYIWRALDVGLFKKNRDKFENSIPTDEYSRDGENGLASAFARFTVPEHGFEVYSEFGREDDVWDMRALVLTPDEQARLTVGFAKAWRSPDGGTRITRLRGEFITLQPSQIDRYRGGRPTYLHSAGSNQGHTQRGQLLGAGVGVSSAAGAFLAVDRLRPDGRWSVEWSRTVRQDRDAAAPTEGPEPNVLDVVHALAVERLFFRGPLELLAGASAGYNYNRDFADDRANLSVYLSLTGLPSR